jgi:hypothetical protein
MEWLSRKTSIAGIQIPTWVVVLCALIVIWMAVGYLPRLLSHIYYLRAW